MSVRNFHRSARALPAARGHAGASPPATTPQITASTHDFAVSLGSHRIHSKKVPELGVAYDERYFRGIYSKHGLSDPPDIYFGRWCGRSTGLDLQDVVIATKL